MDTIIAQSAAATTTILVQSRNAYNLPQQVPGTPNSIASSGNGGNANKIIYSAPSSPAAIVNSNNSGSSGPSDVNSTNSSSSSPASGATIRLTTTMTHQHQHATLTALHTPKKSHLDAGMLRKIRELLMSPTTGCDDLQQALRREVQPVNVIKERYLISSTPCQISPAAAAKTPISYRHLIDLTSSNLKCTDVFTEEHFLCKIINEPLHKVQQAYFQLQQDEAGCRSEIYGHSLIRSVRDIVPLSKQRTYVIIPAGSSPAGAAAENVERIYEDLHTYIRNKRRLSEQEARPLFHQICQTVQVCHRNGIVLRDLKLKRFYFIDEARTKLQYESLEGSMILENPVNDLLSDKIGCPLYTAPELLCPNPTYNGKPADMWSLGVILYTMLVGQYPFYEKGNCNLITIIRHGHVQIPATLGKPVRWLLLGLLRKNYEERLRAEHIFLSPWLRQQQPYYMCIPVDINIPDYDDMDNDSGLEPLDYSCANMQQLADQCQQQQQQQQYDSDDVDMG